MQVHRDLALLPHFRNAVVTIGTFDGVHAGHRKIIEQLQSEAKGISGETVIITFDPHPRRIVRQGQSPVAILTTLPEKLALLSMLGIDHVVVIPFNEQFAAQSAEAYITHFLVERFHPHTVIIGYDHKFGNNRSGDFTLLQAYGGRLGFAVKEIPEHILHEAAISSTRIRQALLGSDVKKANSLLSYPYFFEGLVVKGNQLGRTIGYPTANLAIADAEKLVPGNGVYAVLASHHSPPADSQELAVTIPATARTYKGMMNIGFRPTVDGTRRTIEVNIFDFDKDIYDELLQVQVMDFLRGEEKFAGLDALKNQLAKDREHAERVLNVFNHRDTEGT